MYQNELALAIQAAKDAGKWLKQREKINVDSDAGKDLKLSSDKQSEAIIIERLRQTNIPILSEECGYLEGASDLCWIIDPLDGTVNYWKGLEELSCVSIALYKGLEPVIGVVNRFATNEVYHGLVGNGAFKNDQEIMVSGVKELGKAIVATGFPTNSNFSAGNLGRLIKRFQLFKKVRMLGAAALMGTLVAAGKMDAYMEEGIKLWDVAAAFAIVKAAGGVTELSMLEKDACIARCFATPNLMEAYHAQGL